LGVILVLLVAAMTQQQYSYYIFVRWFVLTSSLYFAYLTLKQQQIGLTIYYVFIAILFNPIKPFWFQKETWHLIDYLVSSITLATIYFDWTKKNIENA
jgi:hypothetical protein